MIIALYPQIRWLFISSISKMLHKNGRSHRRCSAKKGVLRNFSKFTGKHRKTSLAQVFFCEFCEISKILFWQNTSGRLLLWKTCSEKLLRFHRNLLCWSLHLTKLQIFVTPLKRDSVVSLWILWNISEQLFTERTVNSEFYEKTLRNPKNDSVWVWLLSIYFEVQSDR